MKNRTKKYKAGMFKSMRNMGTRMTNRMRRSMRGTRVAPSPNARVAPSQSARVAPAPINMEIIALLDPINYEKDYYDAKELIGNPKLHKFATEEQITDAKRIISGITPEDQKNLYERTLKKYYEKTKPSKNFLSKSRNKYASMNPARFAHVYQDNQQRKENVKKLRYLNTLRKLGSNEYVHGDLGNLTPREQKRLYKKYIEKNN